MKISKENYFKPTPKKWRQIGDSILVCGTALSGCMAFMEYKEIAIIAMVLTVVGKFITNFFKEE
jgi:hypothetical protein